MTDDNGIEEIVEKINEGKSYEQVADELGYASKNVISNKLRRKGFKRNNTFTKANEGRQLLAVISRDELDRAKGDTEGEQHYRKVVEDGRIILELTEDKIEQVEE